MICLKQTLMDLKEVGRSPANIYTHTHTHIHWHQRIRIKGKKDRGIKRASEIHTKSMMMNFSCRLSDF